MTSNWILDLFSKWVEGEEIDLNAVRTPRLRALQRLKPILFVVSSRTPPSRVHLRQPLHDRHR